MHTCLTINFEQENIFFLDHHLKDYWFTVNNSMYCDVKMFVYSTLG